MLGEKVGEERGKMIGQRVLPFDGQPPKIETSFQSSGTLLGVATTGLGTYWSEIRPDGSIYGEGRGIIMSGEGDSLAWTATGVGSFTGEGAGAKFRGAVYWQTASPKFARLNGVAGVYEYDSDAEGNTQINTWEWT